MQDQAHILVVDDDRRIRALLQSYLTDNGFRVSAADSAAEARERMRSMQFDLLVVDVMMPDETGLEFTEQLRQTANTVPILILSALAATSDRIAGLASGSDDYLPKPFEPRELLLRIQNILKRNRTGTMEREFRFGDCCFDPVRGELVRGGEPVRLTTREREYLRVLVQRANQPVSRPDLQQPGAQESARAVDVQINRLRRKIEDDPANPLHLQTVRGAGYILHVD